MERSEGWSNEERLVAIYYVSRSFSRNGILKLLTIKCGSERFDDQVQPMLEDMITEEGQQNRPPLYDASKRGKEWDLDAVDSMIDDIRSQLAPGVADSLMTINEGEALSVLRDEGNPVKIQQNLETLRVRAQKGCRCAAGAPYEALRGSSLQPRGTSNLADVSAVNRENASSRTPFIPVGGPPADPALIATYPLTPGQLGGPPHRSLSSASLGTDFSRVRGTSYHGHRPSTGGLRLPGSSSRGNGKRRGRRPQ